MYTSPIANTPYKAYTIGVARHITPTQIEQEEKECFEKDNKKVVSAKTIEVGDEISVSFSDGKVSAVVNKKEN